MLARDVYSENGFHMLGTNLIGTLTTGSYYTASAVVPPPFQYLAYCHGQGSMRDFSRVMFYKNGILPVVIAKEVLNYSFSAPT
jgi:hypothetical protein